MTLDKIIVTALVTLNLLVWGALVSPAVAHAEGHGCGTIRPAHSAPLHVGAGPTTSCTLARHAATKAVARIVARGEGGTFRIRVDGRVFRVEAGDGSISGFGRGRLYFGAWS